MSEHLPDDTAQVGDLDTQVMSGAHDTQGVDPQLLHDGQIGDERIEQQLVERGVELSPADALGVLTAEMFRRLQGVMSHGR